MMPLMKAYTYKKSGVLLKYRHEIRSKTRHTSRARRNNGVPHQVISVEENCHNKGLSHKETIAVMNWHIKRLSRQGTVKARNCTSPLRTMVTILGKGGGTKHAKNAKTPNLSVL